MPHSDPVYVDFAERLQLACSRAGVAEGRQRITAVAQHFGVSRETARLWFAGRTLPELSRLIEIAREYRCSLDWLAMGRHHENRSAGEFRIAESMPAYASLSAEEQAIIRALRTLSPRRREGLLAFLQSR